MDLASAVIGIASFGVQVSSALYKFSDSARNAEADIVGLAQNIELTSNVLQSVGQILQRAEIARLPNVATKTAIEKTLKGCDTLFQEIMHQVSKKRKLNDDGSYGAVRTYAKFTWPFQKDRMDLNTRKLEHMKTLMLLLLQVLQLAATRTSVTPVSVQIGVANSTMTDQGSSILALKKRLDTLESQFPDLCLDEESVPSGGAAPYSQNTAVKPDQVSNSSSRSGIQPVTGQKDAPVDDEMVFQAEEKPRAGSSSNLNILPQQSISLYQNLPEPSDSDAGTTDDLLTEAAINVCFESINIVLGQLKDCQRCLYLDEQSHGDKLAAQRDLRNKFDDMVKAVHSTLPHGNEQKPNEARLGSPSRTGAVTRGVVSQGRGAVDPYRTSPRALSERVVGISTPAHMRREQEYRGDDYANKFERSGPEVKLEREREYWEPDRRDLDRLREDRAYLYTGGRSRCSSTLRSIVVSSEDGPHRSRPATIQARPDRSPSRVIGTYDQDYDPVLATSSHRKIYSIDDGNTPFRVDNVGDMQARYRNGVYEYTEPKHRYRSESVLGPRRRPSSSVVESSPQSRPLARERDPPTSSALDSHTDVGKDVLSALVFKYTNLSEFNGIERPQEMLS